RPLAPLPGLPADGVVLDETDAAQDQAEAGDAGEQPSERRRPRPGSGHGQEDWWPPVATFSAGWTRTYPWPPKAIWKVSPVPPRTIDFRPPVSTLMSIRTPPVHMTTAWASPKVGAPATSRATGSPFVAMAT